MRKRLQRFRLHLSPASSGCVKRVTGDQESYNLRQFTLPLSKRRSGRSHSGLSQSAGKANGHDRRSAGSGSGRISSRRSVDYVFTVSVTRIAWAHSNTASSIYPKINHASCLPEKRKKFIFEVVSALFTALPERVAPHVLHMGNPRSVFYFPLFVNHAQRVVAWNGNSFPFT